MTKYVTILCRKVCQWRHPSVFLGWAVGPWGRDPFNALDPCSGTPFLSMSGICLHSLLLSQNWKPISSLLHADLSFSSSFFFITSNACICSACVCVCLWCVSMCAKKSVCVCMHEHVWNKMSINYISIYLYISLSLTYVFVSALGFYKMGCHK